MASCRLLQFLHNELNDASCRKRHAKKSTPCRQKVMVLEYSSFSDTGLRDSQHWSALIQKLSAMIVSEHKIAVHKLSAEQLLNSYWSPTVRVVFCLWAVGLTREMRKIPHFGVGIVWRTILSDLPVLWIIVPGCSRNSYGTSPNLWVQKKLVKFWQGTQDTWLCFAKFLREFLSYSPFDLLRDLGDVILSWLRVKYVLCCTASTAFRRFSRNCC